MRTIDGADDDGGGCCWCRCRGRLLMLLVCFLVVACLVATLKVWSNSGPADIIYYSHEKRRKRQTKYTKSIQWWAESRVATMARQWRIFRRHASNPFHDFEKKKNWVKRIHAKSSESNLVHKRAPPRKSKRVGERESKRKRKRKKNHINNKSWALTTTAATTTTDRREQKDT